MMLPLARVCVPVTMKCNMSCIYCLRELCKVKELPDVTPLFEQYIGQLDSDVTHVVCITGGEPLLEFEKIQYIFGLINDKHIRNKVVTNGTLLTKKMVDWFNEHRVEVLVSHDGEITKHTRKVDILENADILKLVRQIDYLHMGSVIVPNKNIDLLANYNYIKQKIGRTDFMYTYSLVSTYSDKLEIDQIDHDKYRKSKEQLVHIVEKRISSKYYHKEYLGAKSWKDIPTGFTVLFDGSVCSMDDIYRYGDVNMTREDIMASIKQRNAIEKFQCRYDNCKIRAYCLNPYTASRELCEMYKSTVS